MTSLELRLMGGLAFRQLDVEKIIKVKKARVLLAYLALHPNQSQSRTFLAGLLWPHSKPDKAQQSLRRAVNELRKHITDFDQFVISDEKNLTINSDHVKVDVLRFERLARSSTAQHLENCRHIYQQGRLLDGLQIQSTAYNRWLNEYTDHIQQVYMRVLQDLSEQYLLDGRHESAIALNQEMIEINPASEIAHRNLMLLYSKTNHPRKFMQQYDDCCRILSITSGDLPEQATTDLYHALLNSAKDQPTANRVNYPAVSSSPRYYEREMTRIFTHARINADSQASHVFLIHGMAGLGKSYLAQNTCAMLQQKGFAVFRTRFFDSKYHCNDGLQDLLIELTQRNEKPNNVDTFVQQLTDSEDHNDLHAAAFYSMLQIPLPADMHGLYSAIDHSQRILTQAQVITYLIRQHTRSRKVVICVDDLQFACQQSIEILKLVFSECRTTGCQFVCTYDTPDKIPSLSIEENPVTKIHLTNYYDRRDALTLTWSSRLHTINSAAKPDSLTEIITAYLDAMTDPERDALLSAAILGMRFDLYALYHLLEDKSFSVSSLIDAGFLCESHEYLYFSHQYIQEILYHSIDEDTLTKKHLAAAEYFKAVDHRRYTFHLLRCRSQLQGDACLTSARFMQDMFRPNIACWYFDRAIALSTNAEDRFRAAIEKADMMLDFSRHVAALRAYEQAIKLAVAPDDRALAGLGMAACLLELGHTQPASQLLSSTRQQLAHCTDHLTLARLYFYLFKQASKSNDLEWEKYIKLAQEHARRADAAKWLSTILCETGYQELRRLNINASDSSFNEALTIAQAYNFVRIEMLVMLGKAELALNNLDFATMNTQLDKAIALANQLQDENALSTICLLSCRQNYYCGMFEKMQLLAARAANHAKKAGDDIKNYHAIQLRQLAGYYLQDEQPVPDVTPIYDTYISYAVHSLTSNSRLFAEQQLKLVLKEMQSLPATLALETGFIAIEACIKHSLWEIGENIADQMIILMRYQPIALYMLSVERLRVISGTGGNVTNGKNRAEIQDLLTQSQHYGLKLHTPAYTQNLVRE